MKYNIDKECWEYLNSTYDMGIRITKKNIRQYEDLFGCCSPDELKQIIDCDIKNAQEALNNNELPFEEFDSLNNIIDDLSLYLKKT